MPPPGDPPADPLAAAFANSAADPLGLLPALESTSAAVLASGYLTRHAGDADEFADASDRVRGSRKILHLLGYLPEDDASDELDDPLRAAVLNFQQEAGLTVDGWVGPETWAALEDLFTFEGETEVSRWIYDPARATVLARAVQLRLVALGLLAEPPFATLLAPAPLGAVLARFAVLSNQLGLAPSPVPGAYDASTITALFDHDGMIHRLAHCDPALAGETASRDFVLSVAQIELWLLHYGVDPDGEVDATEMAAALQRFAADLGAPPGAALATVGFDPDDFGTTFPGFFRQTSLLIHAGEAASPEAARELAQELASRPADYAQTWLDRVAAIGGQIWDGLKRMWGWFKNLFHTAVDKARNLVRLAYRLASDVFALVRDSLAALPAAVRFWFFGEVPAPSGIAIHHSGDFDFRLAADLAIGEDALAQAAGGLRARALQFVFAFRVLRVVIDGLAAAAAVSTTAFTGPLGTIRFIAGLVSARGDASGLITFWREHQAAIEAPV